MQRRDNRHSTSEMPFWKHFPFLKLMRRNKSESAFHNILWTMLSTVWCEVLPFKFYYMSAFATFLSLRLERWLISARFVSVPITNLFWRPIIFLYSLQAPGRTGWAITSWTDFDWSSFDRNLLGQSRIWQNGQSTLEKWVEHPNQSHTMMFTLNFPCHRLCVGWCSSTLTLFLCAPYNLAPHCTFHFPTLSNSFPALAVPSFMQRWI